MSTYSDGTPMPESHKEWFKSGPVTAEALETWLNIIKKNDLRENGERK